MPLKNRSCLKCSRPIPIEAAFCRYCGTEQPETRCSRCGAVPTTESAAYCRSCGQPLQGKEKVRPVPATPQPTRRLFYPSLVGGILLVGLAAAGGATAGLLSDRSSRQAEAEQESSLPSVGLSPDTQAPVSPEAVPSEVAEAETILSQTPEETALGLFRAWEADDRVLMLQFGTEQVANQLAPVEFGDRARGLLTCYEANLAEIDAPVGDYYCNMGDGMGMHVESESGGFVVTGIDFLAPVCPSVGEDEICTPPVSVTPGVDSPTAAALGLYEAWNSGDSQAAERFATSGAISRLFANDPYHLESPPACVPDGERFRCTFVADCGGIDMFVVDREGAYSVVQIKPFGC
jgi:hypothetical protein